MFFFYLLFYRWRRIIYVLLSSNSERILIERFCTQWFCSAAAAIPLLSLGCNFPCAQSCFFINICQFFTTFPRTTITFDRIVIHSGSLISWWWTTFSVFYTIWPLAWVEPCILVTINRDFQIQFIRILYFSVLCSLFSVLYYLLLNS